jgi:uncharacterized protein YbjQ (UPF0145 family)
MIVTTTDVIQDVVIETYLKIVTAGSANSTNAARFFAEPAI